ncbi:MAG: hypothetical protein WCQ64_16910, partial [Acidobacteriota bacterium]
MKIVYLIDQALDARNYDRFGIDTWIARGWAVEVWDLTPLAFPRVWREFLDAGGTLRRFEGHRLVESSADLGPLLSQQDRIDYYVDFGGESAPAVRAK